MTSEAENVVAEVIEEQEASELSVAYVDLCQVFGHGSSRDYAAMGSPSSAGLVRSKNDSMACAGTW